MNACPMCQGLVEGADPTPHIDVDGEWVHKVLGGYLPCERYTDEDLLDDDDLDGWLDDTLEGEPWP